MSNLADRSNLEEDLEDLLSGDTGLGERGRVLSGVGDLLSTALSSYSTGARGGRISSETGRISSIYVGDRDLLLLVKW